MNHKWYHDHNGDVSSMRIMVIPAAWAGILITLAGAVGVFFGVNDSIALAGVGSGLFTIASGAKSLAKNQEFKQ